HRRETRPAGPQPGLLVDHDERPGQTGVPADLHASDRRQRGPFAQEDGRGGATRPAPRAVTDPAGLRGAPSVADGPRDRSPAAPVVGVLPGTLANRSANPFWTSGPGTVAIAQGCG